MAAEVDHTRLLAEFMEMTGTTEEFAVSFLESSDWKLEQAMELFLGGQGGVAQSHSSVSSGDDAEDEQILRIMEQHGVDRETAIAIKEAGGGTESGTTTGGVDADGVRAPILQKRARLFDAFDHDEASESGMGYLAHDMSGLSVANAFEAQLHLARQAMMTGAGEPAKPSFFAPPRWMMYTGSFEEARSEAKAKKRWLMVNIQDQQEFQSLVLNRDLWSDDMTQSLVRESFLFWQQERTSPEAMRFTTLYNPTPPFPHVCIIDPRTGERLKILKLKKKENDLRESFFEQVTEFLDSNTFEAKPRTVAAASSSSSAVVTKSAPSNIEDRELEEAIRASLVVSEAKDRDQSKSTSMPQPVALPAPSAPMQNFGPLSPEPAASGETTTVQFKFPDGSKTKRRFLKLDPVSMLFAYVSDSKKIATGARFDLFTSEVPARSLLNSLENTLVDADACNQNLMVRALQ